MCIARPPFPDVLQSLTRQFLAILYACPGLGLARPAACVAATPARQAGRVLESGDGSAVFAERSMIVTSMQPKISSRRDIAVLLKESPSLEGEEDVNRIAD
jgi:hypothetical protein